MFAALTAEMDLYEGMMLAQGLGKAIIYKEKIIPTEELEGVVLLCPTSAHLRHAMQ